MLRRKILRDIACKQNMDGENCFTLLDIFFFFFTQCTVPIHMVQKNTDNVVIFDMSQFLGSRKIIIFRNCKGVPLL